MLMGTDRLKNSEPVHFMNYEIMHSLNVALKRGKLLSKIENPVLLRICF